MNHLASSLSLALLLTAAPAGFAQYLEEQKLLPDSGSQNEAFGTSVDIDAMTIVVGSRGDDATMTDSGALYAYTYEGVGWSLQQKVKLTLPYLDDEFGTRVALSGDTLIATASYADVHGTNAGAVFVFERSGGVWGQQQQLVAGDTVEFDGYGASLAIEGNTAVVGATQNDTITHTTGAAYVFVRSGGTWTLQQKLWANDGAVYDSFGASISLSGDTVVIGSPGDDDDGSGSGSAHVFLRTGTTWTLQQKLTASDAEAGANFGVSVAVDGETIAIGAQRDDGAAYQSGSAYVFVRGGSAWTEEQKLTASDGTPNDEFGISIGLDAETVVVGASHSPSGSLMTGAAYVFTRHAGTWTEAQRIWSGMSGTYDGGAFGCSIAIDSEAIVGGNWLDDDMGHNSGAARTFRKIPEPGTPFCFGDGSGTDCPCDNDASEGEGCENSTGAGAILEASGSQSIAAANLVLTATQCPPTRPGLFFQGNHRVAGGLGSLLGNGLRCAGGGVIRLQVAFADPSGVARTTIDVAAKGGVVAGTTYHYQFWYRDPDITPPCSEFNLTNGYSITWE